MANQARVIKHADRKITRLFRFIVVNIGLTFFLAAVFYADPFHFWQHALSELGATITLLGSSNLTSSIIIIVGMFINGRLLLETARTYRNHSHILHAGTKSWLLYTASLGSFISIFPNNLFHTIHSVGSGLMVGSLFLVDLIILTESLEVVRPLGVYLSIVVLCLSVLSYAVTYFLRLPIKQATQKICVINLLLIFYEHSYNFLHVAEPEAHTHSHLP